MTTSMRWWHWWNIMTIKQVMRFYWHTFTFNSQHLPKNNTSVFAHLQETHWRTLIRIQFRYFQKHIIPGHPIPIPSRYSHGSLLLPPGVPIRSATIPSHGIPGEFFTGQVLSHGQQPLLLLVIFRDFPMEKLGVSGELSREKHEKTIPKLWFVTSVCDLEHLELLKNR